MRHDDDMMDFDQFLQKATLALNALWEDEYGGREIVAHELQHLNSHLEDWFADKCNS